MHSSFSTGQTEQMKRYSEFILQADGWEKSMLQHIRSGFPGGSEVKVSACHAGDLGLIPGSGRSPGEGNGNPLQYSCLENPMVGGAGGLQSMGSQRVRHDWAKKKKSGLSVIKGFKCCYHWLFTTVKVPVLSFLFLLHIISFYKILLKGWEMQQ